MQDAPRIPPTPHCEDVWVPPLAPLVGMAAAAGSSMQARGYPREIRGSRAELSIGLWSLMLMGLLSAKSEAAATEFFESGEEALNADSPLPEPKWAPYGDAWRECRRGHVRAAADAPVGAQVIEFEALAACYTGAAEPNHDIFNELRYDVPPPAGGTLYTGVFFRTGRVGGQNLWADPNPGVETFDKAIELVGPNYRWTVNMGTRDHYYSAGPEFDGKFSLFFGHPNPGHFNTESRHCGPGPAGWEDYDSYWQNVNGYGGSRPDTECYPSNSAQPFWMSYDRWYAIVTKVVFRSDDTGSIEAWIDGVQVLGLYDIQTCGSDPCQHDRAQLWGTYSQPDYQGPDHRRLIDALVITDDPTYLQVNGYFRAPGNAVAVDGGLAPDAAPDDAGAAIDTGAAASSDGGAQVLPGDAEAASQLTDAGLASGSDSAELDIGDAAARPDRAQTQTHCGCSDLGPNASPSLEGAAALGLTLVARAMGRRAARIRRRPRHPPA